MHNLTFYFPFQATTTILFALEKSTCALVMQKRNGNEKKKLVYVAVHLIKLSNELEKYVFAYHMCALTRQYFE
jgi:hypothetical protein